MSFEIKRADITRMDADILVCSTSRMHRRFSGAERQMLEAGGERMQEAQRLLPVLEEGVPCLADAGNLPAKQVMYIVSPSWNEALSPEENRARLQESYRSCMETAVSAGARSVVFPLLSAGFKGFSVRDAVLSACACLMEWVLDERMKVILAVFDEKSFREASKIQIVRADITGEYARDRLDHSGLYEGFPKSRGTGEGYLFFQPENCPDFYGNFSEYAGRRNLSDPQVYAACETSRKTFHNWKTGETFPKREELLTLCFAMKLTAPEAEAFLRSLGYCFNPGSRREQIMKRCLQDGQTDPVRVSALLGYNGEKPLFDA